MYALDTLPQPRLQMIEYLLTDIDDTLTTNGKLTPEAYHALGALEKAGIKVIAVTGRPAGWCDHIARMWPVSAIVGENGAFYFYYDKKTQSLQQGFLEDEMVRDLSRQRLTRLRRKIQTLFPNTRLASDQFCRIADLAIDVSEDVEPLTETQIESIMAMARDEGATASLSSIHINIWYGHYNKLGMTEKLFADIFGQSLPCIQERCLYVGDSPNDSPMFDFFSLSVGVANVRDFAGKLDKPPKYVTDAKAGAGFVELAMKIIAARSAS